MSEPHAVKAAMNRLGFGFIRKLRAARSMICDMRKIAEKHGECCPPCEIPEMTKYLQSVEEQLDWYLNSLHESSEKDSTHGHHG